MRFRITATTIWNNDKAHILNKYPFLKDFTFEEIGEEICTIEIHEIDDLLRLKELCKSEIIITTPLVYGEVRKKVLDSYGVSQEIEIYDGYRE